MHPAPIQVYLVPAEVNSLTNPQRVPVHNQDEQAVPFTMSAKAFRGFDKLVDFGNRQILPGALLQVRHLRRRPAWFFRLCLGLYRK